MANNKQLPLQSPTAHNSAAGAAPADGKKTIEEVYRKKTQLEHILLWPDTYIGSVKKHTQTIWVFEDGEMVQRLVTYVLSLYKIFDEILVIGEAHVTPDNRYTVEHVEGTKIGASTFDSYGRRHSAADLLEYANPENLRVATRATVDRIMFNSSSGGHDHSKPSAAGVLYRDSSGRAHHAVIRPGGEVILSAGAIGSPQLLLLSGIGPHAYLSSLGIPVVADHPEVGRHVYDNPRNAISIALPES